MTLKRFSHSGLLSLTFLLLLQSPLSAWGPHQPITAAALEVLPEEQQGLREAAGRSNLRDSQQENWRNLQEFSMMPDHGVTDYAGFWAPDYNRIRSLPKAVSHLMPGVMEAIEPQFRRALQALETETFTEAFRRMGPILHYVQDIGSPPHATPISEQPAHTLMETWDTRNVPISIQGYEPVLLGGDADEALEGLLQRIDGLVAYSSERAEKLLPLVREHGREGQEHYLHLVLESAHETARVTADLLHTLFTIGLRDGQEGAALSGRISFDPTVRYHDGRKGTRLALLDADLFEKTDASDTVGDDIHQAATEFSTFTDEEGAYDWRNLPEGRYRLFAYRLGARPQVSEPFELVEGESSIVNLQLQPDEPQGNILYNPRGWLFDVCPDQPDRWQETPEGYQQTIHIAGTYSRYLGGNTPEAAFRIGAKLRDPEARVVVRFSGYNVRAPWKEVVFENGEVGLVEEDFTFPWKQEGRNFFIDLGEEAERLSRITVEVQTKGKLHDAVENLWVLPVFPVEE